MEKIKWIEEIERERGGFISKAEGKDLGERSMR